MAESDYAWLAKVSLLTFWCPAFYYLYYISCILPGIIYSHDDSDVHTAGQHAYCHDGKYISICSRHKERVDSTSTVPLHGVIKKDPESCPVYTVGTDCTHNGKDSRMEGSLPVPERVHAQRWPLERILCIHIL